MRKLAGGKWKMVQRLIYLAYLGAIMHFARIDIGARGGFESHLAYTIDWKEIANINAERIPTLLFPKKVPRIYMGKTVRLLRIP